jgi:hypothetical protein
MDFGDWLYEPTVPDDDNVSVYLRLREGEYADLKDLLLLLEEAYEVGKEAGWVQAGDYL